MEWYGNESVNPLPANHSKLSSAFLFDGVLRYHVLQPLWTQIKLLPWEHSDRGSEGSVFSRLSRGRNSCRCFCVELVKLLSVHRYSVDIVSYSGPSGILGSGRKHNTTKAGARGVRIVAISISSHEQTENESAVF